MQLIVAYRQTETAAGRRCGKRIETLALGILPRTAKVNRVPDNPHVGHLAINNAKQVLNADYLAGDFFSPDHAGKRSFSISHKLST